jgi:23S rRNA pseudouridine2605 synthase
MSGEKHRPARGERIAKVIARAGLASRREAEAWIAAGRVAVNGEVVVSPARTVTAADRIAVDGAPLPARERTRLFLYHKPRGLVTTHADPGGRPNIFGALPPGLPRLVSVGRLDIDTEGLILLTNDGGLARALELPATQWLRRYRVRAHGRVAQEALDRLRRGITIDGIRYGAIEATVDRTQGANVWLTFAIREGKNREVKNVLGHLGLAVNRLIRVSYGPFRLGELPAGAIEEVRTRTLREQLGERLAAQAGVDFAGPIVPRQAPPPRHSGARATPASPDSMTTERGRFASTVVTETGPRAHARDSYEGHAVRRAPGRKRRGDPDRIGEPERARREKRRRRRSARGKNR